MIGGHSALQGLVQGDDWHSGDWASVGVVEVPAASDEVGDPPLRGLPVPAVTCGVGLLWWRELRVFIWSSWVRGFVSPFFVVFASRG